MSLMHCTMHNSCNTSASAAFRSGRWSHMKLRGSCMSNDVTYGWTGVEHAATTRTFARPTREHCSRNEGAPI